MKTNETDNSIIERILSGDKSGYKDLANRHKDYAFTVAYKIAGTREDAEEIAQDAFIQAFQALPNFNQEAKFTTWFYRIVFNAALMFKRKNRIHTEDIEASQSAQFVSADTDNDLKIKEQRKYIQQALNHLPPDDVTIITLFYLKEQSLEEIAQVVGVSAETIKVKLCRARKKLAEEMKKILGGEVKTLI
ncbi:RNA polymerase sigma-70 factor (ECF subfamily) [Arcicella aurantiaca]|uniref:RNA polymerase sigma factor n=1 Tax=Arcicella aurantiaca TaxID=591202 RepID=A0A316EF93_9BACT|nr:RNA polymerase sigma factor [Arcicella aurantiaca]PWK28781.1 RNA polymerase sigma-70 factor (ECF subfamily) [Arcicella aurantiaca]